MNIFLGTTSQDKKNILIDYLQDTNFKDFSIQIYDVDSGVNSQPIGEELILSGARNRAINALEFGKSNGIGLGLEGGLTTVSEDDRYYLVCIAVIRDTHGNDFIGISNKLILPKSISDLVKNGKEFGVVIREEAAQMNDISDYYQELISRNLSFKQAVHKAFVNYFNSK